MRCKKKRQCRDINHGSVFKPTGIPLKDLEVVEIERDEFEALRLCDHDNCHQSDAGIRMGISRGTVQRLLYTGRKKIVTALLQQKAIQIKQEE